MSAEVATVEAPAVVEAYVYAPSADGRRFIGPATRTVQLGSFLGVMSLDDVFTVTRKHHPGVYDPARITHSTPRFFYRISPVEVDDQVFNAVWCYTNQRSKVLPVDPADPAFRTPESADLRRIEDDESEVEPPREFSYFLAWLD